MERIRQLPDGRYVEKGAKKLYFRNADGSTIEELQRNGERYVALGLRSDMDDRAVYHPHDPSMADDPYVLVWEGSTQKYLTRAESNVIKYGSATPTDEQIEAGGYLPPYAANKLPTAWPPTAPKSPELWVKDAPADNRMPSVFERVAAFFRRLFGR